MKNPPNWGTVYKIDNNKRNNPWVAKIPVGSFNGRTQYQTIGYYQTRREAKIALDAFHQNPYDLSSRELSFAQLYDLWKSVEVPVDESPVTTKNREATYKKLSPIHKKSIDAISMDDIKTIIDNLQDNPATATAVLKLTNRVFRWAVKASKLQKNPAELVKVRKAYKTEAKEVFTTEEIKSIHSFIDKDYTAKTAYILIYTGMRIGELLQLKQTEIDINKRIITVNKSKTDAGIRRIPIHKNIISLLEELIDGREYLINGERYGRNISYKTYEKNYFKPLMNSLGIEHTIHCTRHTFTSMAVTAGCNPTIIKLIIGHKSSQELYEKVYTHISDEALIAEVDKIK